MHETVDIYVLSEEWTENRGRIRRTAYRLVEAPTNAQDSGGKI